MKDERVKETHKLSKEQRAQVFEWFNQGITSYRTIRLLLIEHRFPLVNRQAIHYYRQLWKERER